jgi:hypothetical protein
MIGWIVLAGVLAAIIGGVVWLFLSFWKVWGKS